MTTNRCFDLMPNTSQKSFYGKARVVENNDTITLYSYDTAVCAIVNGVFKKLWFDYSATTMKHINAFCEYYGINGRGKKWWDSL